MIIIKDWNEFHNNYENVPNGLKSGELYFIQEDNSMSIKTSDVTGKLETYYFQNYATKEIGMEIYNLTDSATYESDTLPWFEEDGYVCLSSDNIPYRYFILKIEVDGTTIKIQPIICKKELTAANDPSNIDCYTLVKLKYGYVPGPGNMQLEETYQSTEIGRLNTEGLLGIYNELYAIFDDIMRTFWATHKGNEFPYTLEVNTEPNYIIEDLKQFCNQLANEHPKFSLLEF